jgi:hypothetical protein
MYADTLESTVGAEMWRNIPHDENITNSGVALQLLNVVDKSMWMDDSQHGTVLSGTWVH